MASFKKSYKRYERVFLLGLVFLLLATFSIGGAMSCEPQRGEREAFGGSLSVPGGGEVTVDDEEWTRTFDNVRALQSSTGTLSAEYADMFDPRDPPEMREATWTHILGAKLGSEAGYKAGKSQVNQAVRDLVQARWAKQTQRVFDDQSYSDFLRNYVRMSQSEFEEFLGEVVVRDQFITPLIESAKYRFPMPEVFEEWKHQRERVDLEYVSLPAKPLEAKVTKQETTRETIEEELTRLRQLSLVARNLRTAGSQIDAASKKDGTLPADLASLRRGADAPVDSWGTPLDYKVDGETYSLRSAGPDKSLGNDDDVTDVDQRALQSYARLVRVGNALQAWKRVKDAWPKDLATLQTAPNSETTPPLPKTEKLEDGWKREIVFVPPTGDGPAVVSSLGADGEPGGDDDYRLEVTDDPIRLKPFGRFARRAPDAEATPKDGWGRPLRLSLADPARLMWEVRSAGADGTFDNDDDLTTGNKAEIARFFSQPDVRRRFREPLRREFEALFVNLPNLSDGILEVLWKNFPDARPADEETVFEHWKSHRGGDALSIYNARDPSDPEAGHGAATMKEIAPDTKLHLRPSPSVFPDLGHRKPAEPTGEKPGDETPGEEESSGDEEAPADPDQALSKEYEDKGWREIVIRELLVESILNDLLKKLQANQKEIREWDRRYATKGENKEDDDKQKDDKKKDEEKGEAKNDDEAKDDKNEEGDSKETEEEPPARPTELTLEGLFDDALRDAVPTADEEAKGHRSFIYFKTTGGITHDEWEALPALGDPNLSLTLGNLSSDGQYASIPVQLHGRITKALLRQIKLSPAHDPEFDDIKDDVFEAFVSKRALDMAFQELGKLKSAIQTAEDENAETGADTAFKEFEERIGVPFFRETTGMFIGARPPQATELDGEDEEADKKEERIYTENEEAIRRRNYVLRTGYATVRKGTSQQDSVEAAPGTFGRRVLRDGGNDSTGSAYLIRVKDRQFPDPAEFSPRDYLVELYRKVYGTQGRDVPLAKRDGSFFESLRRYTQDYQWLKSTFDVKLDGGKDLNAPVVK